METMDVMNTVAECAVCLGLTTSNFTSLKTNKWWGSYHRFEPYQLWTSATKGCSGCIILVRGISLFLLSSEVIIEIHVFPSNDDQNGPLNVLLYMHHPDTPLGMPRRPDASVTGLSNMMNQQGGPGRVRLTFAKRLQFYTTSPNVPAPWPMIGPGHPRGSCGLLSETAVLGIRRWIHDCAETHPLCNAISPSSTGNPPNLPKRVIDLGTNVQGLDEPVRLRESLEERGEYACLSYCWGDALFLKTEIRTLSAHKNGIAWSSLSKTFQDGIRVARILGIRWLWIDALCIIQDDKNDWALEAAKMGSIYENSTITLSATGSKNGDGGFFHPEENDYELTLSTESTEECSIRVRCDDFCYNGRMRPLDPDKYPTMYRGWCYQERLLSRRVLNFGRQELFWECKSLSTCECQLHEDNPSLDLYERYAHQVEDQLQSMLRNEKVGFEKNLLRPEDSRRVLAWHEIVTKYTRLGLTNASDRLPAISGVAKLVQMERNGTVYLAGIWKDSVLEDLTWFAQTYMPFPKAEQWTAPSWTWAAVEGAVEFVRASRDMLWHARILEGSCNPSTDDPTGPVSSGFLKVSGPICPAILSRPTKVQDNHGLPYKVTLTSKEAKDSDASSPRWDHFFFPDFVLPELETEYASMDVYCLAVVTDQAYSFVEPDFFRGNYYLRATFYLVLKSINSDSVPAMVYERIGLARQEEFFPGNPSRLRSQEVAQWRRETLEHPASGNVVPKGVADKVITLI
ncbi:heterokaryon incompatibility protein-domain-containing protein [Cadophora sp. MPI-SDFR-AT-0126]|nr:heterokaryon incompatibility protein-domain-containing protein [Leotiomycetes sp. MPI-SDFR-AT-0126]